MDNNIDPKVGEVWLVDLSNASERFGWLIYPMRQVISNAAFDRLL